MSVLNKIKLNSELYDIGAKIENISIDEAFLGRYNDDILFVSGVVAWKNDIEDISFDSLILTEILDNDSVKYLLSVSNTDGSVSYYGKDGAIDTPDINKALTHEEVKAKSTNNSDINLKILVDYLLNNDNNSSILFDYNIFNATTRRDSISECKTIYELLKYFDGTVAGPTERIIHITDFSKSERSEIMESYGAYEPRTKKHTVDENGNECVANQDEDVDIVLINHSGDMDSTRTEDGMVQSIYQTVRIYKQDGALELGSGKAEGFSAIATGKNTSAAGDFSVAMGNESSVGEYGESGIALGKGAIVYSEGTVALGSYNTGDSSAVLDVGNGKGPRGNERSSSFKSMKNGENWSKSAFTIAADDGKEPTDNELIVNTDKFVVTKEGDFKAKGFGIIDGESDNNGNVLEVNTPNGYALKTYTNKDTDIAHDLYVGNDEFVTHDSTIGHDESVGHRLTVGEYIIDGQYDSSIDSVNINNIDVTYDTLTGDRYETLEKYPGNKIYNTTYSHTLNPTKDITYDLGYGWSKESSEAIPDEEKKAYPELRWRKLWVKDIDASGEINADSIKANNLDVKSDENNDPDNVPTFNFNSNLYPTEDDKFSLGDFDKRWLDGYYSGRLFGESINTESISNKFGEYFILKSPRQYNSSYAIPSLKTKAISNKSEAGKNQRLVLYTTKGGNVESFPTITIDYNTGHLEFSWIGWTKDAINFYPARKGPTAGGMSANRAGYHTRPVYPLFHYGSLIASAIGKNIPLTCFVDGPSTTTRYTGYVKCGSTSAGKKALNNFIKKYSTPWKEGMEEGMGSSAPVFYYHNMFCFAKRHGYPRKVIEYYKKKRNELIIGVLREDGTYDTSNSLSSAGSTLYGDWKATMSEVINSEATTNRGCIYFDSTTAIPVNGYVVISGSCQTNLDYENLVFIKHLIDELSKRNSAFATDMLQYNFGSKFFWNADAGNSNVIYNNLLSDLNDIYGVNNIPDTLPTINDITTDSFNKTNDGYSFNEAEIEVGKLDTGEEEAGEAGVNDPENPDDNAGTLNEDFNAYQ